MIHTLAEAKQKLQGRMPREEFESVFGVRLDELVAWMPDFILPDEGRLLAEVGLCTLYWYLVSLWTKGGADALPPWSWVQDMVSFGMAVAKVFSFGFMSGQRYAMTSVGDFLRGLGDNLSAFLRLAPCYGVPVVFHNWEYMYVQKWTWVFHCIGDLVLEVCDPSRGPVADDVMRKLVRSVGDVFLCVSAAIHYHVHLLTTFPRGSPAGRDESCVVPHALLSPTGLPLKFGVGKVGAMLVDNPISYYEVTQPLWGQEFLDRLHQVILEAVRSSPVQLAGNWGERVGDLAGLLWAVSDEMCGINTFDDASTLKLVVHDAIRVYSLAGLVNGQLREVSVTVPTDEGVCRAVTQDHYPSVLKHLRLCLMCFRADISLSALSMCCQP
jgi:hypothetical protein